jgi:hypothetical protein
MISMIVLVVAIYLVSVRQPLIELTGWKKIDALRLVILIQLIAIAVEFWALRFDSTLPVELRHFKEAQVAAVDAGHIDDRVWLSILAAAAVSIAFVVGGTGLWWCRRWARILFSASAVLIPPMTAADGVVLPESLITNAVAYSANVAGCMVLGVLLAMIWLWMPEEFRRPKMQVAACGC